MSETSRLALARLVETRIIPRLFLTRAGRCEGLEPACAAPSAKVATFTQLVLARGIEDVYAAVATLLATGTSLEAVFLDVFAPVAVRLGELWDTDECSFSDVTLALCKLHRMVRAFSRHEQAVLDLSLGRVLIAAVPGNQHLLGVVMIEELFRRSGWSVCALPASSADEIVEGVTHEWFAVVGLSMSLDDHAGATETLIARVRDASLNRSVAVLVGGRYFVENPEMALRMGADATAQDAQRAITESRRFVEAAKHG